MLEAQVGEAGYSPTERWDWPLKVCVYEGSEASGTDDEKHQVASCPPAWDSPERA